MENTYLLKKKYLKNIKNKNDQNILMHNKMVRRIRKLSNIRIIYLIKIKKVCVHTQQYINAAYEYLIKSRLKYYYERDFF